MAARWMEVRTVDPLRLALVVLPIVLAGACHEGRAGSEASSPAVDPQMAPGTDRYSAHVAALRARAPAGFTIVEERPFVVVGDESPDRVAARATSTVRWTVERLKALYFQAEPKDIIDVWLFKNEASYMHHAEVLFGDTPSTPYGYYSSSHRALVMNISTGGGTLVHEIVHPFVEADFPDCPAWFNEALGSLYEQSAEREGRIVGLTNWRLAGLQEAIGQGRFIPLSRLTSMGDGFYDGDSGLHYAEARYLAYYLQEKDLLAGYYKAFRARVGEDPTGYATLQDALGRPDMARFEDSLRSFVMGLRFDG